MKTALTGIKPTHGAHLGNYLGAIRPALELAKRYDSIYFVADYHALTSLRDPAALRRHVYDVTAAWLACGLDRDKTILFRQSDVVEVFELAWILSCLLATGQLERGHAYKDAVGKGVAPNAGLFYYPVLMAADILLYDTDIVPVGPDQRQHLEITRDVAARVNHHYGADTLVVPEAGIAEAPMVPGLDGQKMSKSHGNHVPLFATAQELRHTIFKIETGSESLEEPKVPEGSTIFELYKLVAPEAKVAQMADALRTGGYGWGHAKEALFEALDKELAPKREKYETLRDNEELLDEILAAGAIRARVIARRTIQRVRTAIGVGQHGRDLRKTVKLKP